MGDTASAVARHLSWNDPMSKATAKRARTGKYVALDRKGEFVVVTGNKPLPPIEARKPTHVYVSQKSVAVIDLDAKALERLAKR